MPSNWKLWKSSITRCCFRVDRSLWGIDRSAAGAEMLQLNQSAPTDWSATPQDEESKAKLHWPQRGAPRTCGRVITMHGTCAWYFKPYQRNLHSPPVFDIVAIAFLPRSTGCWYEDLPHRRSSVSFIKSRVRGCRRLKRSWPRWPGPCRSRDMLRSW